jgi:tape measure domain-containing protein
MASISGSGLSLGTLFVNIAANIQDALSSLSKFGSEAADAVDKGLGQVEKEANDAANEIDKSFSGLAKDVSSVLGALAGALALGKFISDAQDYAKELRGVQKSFEALYGASQDTRDVLDSISTIAKSSPFDFKTVAEGAKNLALAGMSAQDANKAIQAVVDTVAALKLGPDTIGKVTDALATMQARGEVTTRSMIGLVKEGIPAWQLLADEIGVSVPAAQDLVAKHAIDSATIIEAVVNGMGDAYAGAALKASQTWGGELKRISEGATEAGASIIGSITSFLNKLAPALEPVTKALEGFSDWWKSLPGPIKDAAAAIAIAVSAVAGLIGVITAAGAAIAGIELALGALGVAIGPVLGVAAAVAAVTAALIFLGGWVSDHWDAISKALTEAWDGIKEIWGGTWSSITSTLTGLWDGFIQSTKRDFEALATFFAAIWDGLVAAYKAIWGAIFDVLKGVWAIIQTEAHIFDQILSYLLPIWEPLKQAFSAAWQWVLDTLTGIWSKIQATAALLGGAAAQVSQAVVAQVQQTNQQLDQAEKDRLKKQEDYAKLAKELGVQTTADLQADADRKRAIYNQMAADVAAGIGSENDLAAARLAVQAADKAVTDGTQALQQARAKAAAEAKKQADEEQRNLKESQQLVDKLEKAYDQLDKTNQRWGTTAVKAMGKLQEEGLKAVKITVSLVDQISNINPAIGAWVKQVQQVNAAFKDLGITSEKQLGLIADKADSDLKVVDDARKKNIATEADYQAALEKSKQAHKNLADYINQTELAAYKALGVTSSQVLQQQVADAEKAYQTLKASGDASTADLYNAWQAVLKAQQAVADNLNKEVIDAYHAVGQQAPSELQKIVTDTQHAYETIAASAGENSIAAQQAWITNTEAAFKEIIAAGGTVTTAQQNELDKQKQQLENSLPEHFATWKKTYDAVHDTISQTFDSLEERLITGKGSFSEILTNMWQGLAKAALDAFVNPVKTAIEDFIANTIADLLSGRGLGGVLDSIKEIGTQLAGVFTAANDVADTAGDVAKGAGGAASSGASSAGSAISQVASGLTGLVSAVSGVVSAISGVVSNFQLHAVNKSLDVIVNHTLRIFNELFNLRADEWDRWGGWMQIKDDILNRLNTIMDDANLARDQNSDMIHALNSIMDSSSAGVAILQSMADAQAATDAQQTTLFDKLFASLDRITAGQQQAMNVTLAGSDPALVAAKLAQQLRLQGAVA